VNERSAATAQHDPVIANAHNAAQGVNGEYSSFFAVDARQEASLAIVTKSHSMSAAPADDADHADVQHATFLNARHVASVSQRQGLQLMLHDAGRQWMDIQDLGEMPRKN